MLDVAERREFSADLPVEHVIRIGPRGHREPAGVLRRLLAGQDGWILVRPDAHIAWASVDLQGIAEAARHALGR